MPDVTWHPVSETPPTGCVPLFINDAETGVLLGTATFFECGAVYLDFDWKFVHHVTHWAEMIYPPPPEEA
ncbi:MAG: hypothetical protein WC565_08945 [Parcubacteria group bacterium]|jgi:hypothetical protein